MMNYRQRQDILDPAYDLSDLEEIIAGKPTPRRIREAVPKLWKLIGEGTLRHGWTQLGRTDTPMVNSRTIRLPKAIMLDEKGNPKPTSRPGYDREKHIVVIAAMFDGGGALTLHDSMESMHPVPGEIFIAPSCEPQKFKLTKFGQTSGLFVRGMHIDRQTSISFLRNKRGGSHKIEWEIKKNDKDPKRTYELLASINDPKATEIAGQKFDVQFTNFGLNMLELHIWHTINDLVKSPDIMSFLAQIRSHPAFRDEFSSPQG